MFNRINNLGLFGKRKKIYLRNITLSEKAYLLGAFYGDGNSYEGIDFQQKDEDFSKYLASLLSKILNKEIKPKYYERIHKNGDIEKGYRTRAHSRDLRDWLNNKKSYIFKTQKEKIGFISGFFDAEGDVVRRKDRKSCGLIRMSQKDKTILLQISDFLTNINIINKIYIEREIYHRLVIGQKDSQRRFYKMMNIQIKRKELKMKGFLQ